MSDENRFELRNLPLPIVHSDFTFDLRTTMNDEPLLIHDHGRPTGLQWGCPVCEHLYSIREAAARRRTERWCYRCDASSVGTCGLFRVRPHTIKVSDGLTWNGATRRTGWVYQILMFNEVVCDINADRELPLLRQAVEEAVRFRADAPQWVKALAGYARRRLLYGDHNFLCPDCGQDMASDIRKQVWCLDPDCGYGCEWQTEKPYPVFMPPFGEDDKLGALQEWLVENGYDAQAASVKKGMGL